MTSRWDDKPIGSLRPARPPRRKPGIPPGMILVWLLIGVVVWWLPLLLTIAYLKGWY